MDRALSRGPAGIEVAIAPMLDAVVAALRSGGSLRDGLDAAARHELLGPALRAVLARADAGVGLRDALDVRGVSDV